MLINFQGCVFTFFRALAGTVKRAIMRMIMERKFKLLSKKRDLNSSPAFTHKMNPACGVISSTQYFHFASYFLFSGLRRNWSFFLHRERNAREPTRRRC